MGPGPPDTLQEECPGDMAQGDYHGGQKPAGAPDDRGRRTPCVEAHPLKRRPVGAFGAQARRVEGGFGPRRVDRAGGG